MNRELNNDGRAVSDEQSQTSTSLSGQVTAKDMREFYQANRHALDTNDDGFVSVDELSTFKVTNSRDSQTIDGLIKYLPDIQLMSNDEWGEENDGITEKDMLFYEVELDDLLPEKQLRVAEFARLIDLQFRFFDNQGTGTISLERLRATQKSSQLDRESRDAVDFMIRSYDGVDLISGGNGLTRQALRLMPHVMLSPWHAAESTKTENMQQNYEEGRLSMNRALGAMDSR